MPKMKTHRGAAKRFKRRAGGGFKRVVAGETAISNASRPIKLSEIKAAQENGIEFIEIAVAYDGLSICVNKDNDWVTELSVDQLNEIFADGSTVRTWRDLDPSYPAVEIKMFIPGTDSGTFDYFKEVERGDEGAGRATQLTVSEDDNILVEGIESDRGGIGVFGCSYYFENQDVIRAVPIKPAADKDGVYPTPDTIASNEYQPFARPLFIYVNAEAADRPEVRTFVNYYLNNAADIAPEVGYVRLAREVGYRSALRFQQGVTGSVFWDLEEEEKIDAPLLDLLRGTATRR